MRCRHVEDLAGLLGWSCRLSGEVSPLSAINIFAVLYHSVRPLIDILSSCYKFKVLWDFWQALLSPHIGQYLGIYPIVRFYESHHLVYCRPSIMVHIKPFAVEQVSTTHHLARHFKDSVENIIG